MNKKLLLVFVFVYTFSFTFRHFSFIRSSCVSLPLFTFFQFIHFVHLHLLDPVTGTRDYYTMMSIPFFSLRVSVTHSKRMTVSFLCHHQHVVQRLGVKQFKNSFSVLHPLPSFFTLVSLSLSLSVFQSILLSLSSHLPNAQLDSS